MSTPPSHPLASRLGSVPTERLRLVPLTLDDREELRIITDDPTVTGSISFLSSPFTEADAGDLIRQGLGSHDCFFGIRDKSDDTLAGIIGAHLREDDAVEIGYWIGRAFRRRGVATEAARGLIERLEQRLPQRRIIAECRPDNAASWQVLAKIGFRPTGASGMRPGRQLLAIVRES